MSQHIFFSRRAIVVVPLHRPRLLPATKPNVLAGGSRRALPRPAPTRTPAFLNIEAVVNPAVLRARQQQAEEEAAAAAAAAAAARDEGGVANPADAAEDGKDGEGWEGTQSRLVRIIRERNDVGWKMPRGMAKEMRRKAPTW